MRRSVCQSSFTLRRRQIKSLAEVRHDFSAEGFLSTNKSFHGVAGRRPEYVFDRNGYVRLILMGPLLIVRTLNPFVVGK